MFDACYCFVLLRAVSGCCVRPTETEWRQLALRSISFPCACAGVGDLIEALPNAVVDRSGGNEFQIPTTRPVSRARQRHSRGRRPPRRLSRAARDGSSALLGGRPTHFLLVANLRVAIVCGPWEMRCRPPASFLRGPTDITGKLDGLLWLSVFWLPKRFAVRFGRCDVWPSRVGAAVRQIWLSWATRFGLAPYSQF